MKDLLIFVCWIYVYSLITIDVLSSNLAAEHNKTICQNGGNETVDGSGNITCQCRTYYTGDYCETVLCDYCEGILYDHLFQNYNARIRPAVKPTDNTTVDVSFTNNNLLDIVEKDEVMEVMGFFSLGWSDKRLSWDPYDFGGVTLMVVPAQDVWLPDVIISNTATSFYQYTYKRDFFVRFSYDGSVAWEFGGIIQTSCDIDMSNYPFDNQTCEILLETWTYNTNQVDLNVGYLFLPASVYGNALWNLTSSSITKMSIWQDNYRRITIKFAWQRKQLYYYMNLIIPALMLVLVCLGVYWLPSESGEKVSLAVTLLLAFSVFLIIIMDNTPTNSSQVPIITLFFILIMSITTVSLLVSIFIAFVNGKSQRAPKWLRVLCFNCLAKIMFMKSYIPEENTGMLVNQLSPVTIKSTGKTDGNSSFKLKQEESSLQNELKVVTKMLVEIIRFLEDKKDSNNIQYEWLAIGRVIDRFCFWVSFILILVIFPLIFVGII